MTPSDLLMNLGNTLRAAHVYGILRLAQTRKALVSYTDLAYALREFSGGNTLATALGEVMSNCKGTEDDLLPAIVSKREGDKPLGPGEGFYTKAESLGYKVGVDKDAFWKAAIAALGYDLQNLRFI